MGRWSSRGFDDQRDGCRQSIPFRGLGLQGFSSGRGELVVLGASSLLAHAPLGGDPALLLELMEGGIQRALADVQLIAGQETDLLRDGPAVHGLELDGAQDEKAEGALEEAGGL